MPHGHVSLFHLFPTKLPDFASIHYSQAKNFFPFRHGFPQRVVPRSLLRRALIQDTDVPPSIHIDRDVKNPPALQLEGSAQMPHPVGSCGQRNTIWGKVELGGGTQERIILASPVPVQEAACTKPVQRGTDEHTNRLLRRYS